VRSLIYIFAYVFVPVTACTCVRIGCASQLRCRSLLRCRRPANLVSGRVDLFSPVCYRRTRSQVTAAVFKLAARFLVTFQVRRCWIKIDSAVNLGETPSLEFVQCVLWVIWLTKTVESICCAVHHTVTLPRAVWRTIRSPHSVRVLIATTTDAGRHRPFTALPTTPAVRFVSVVYYAVVTTRLLLACCLPLATSFWWHSRFYPMLHTPFFLLYLFVFS